MQEQEKPLLSICIPTYNRAGLLRETLDILADQLQHNPSFEIVVSNNCSSDNTIEVLEDFKKGWEKFRYITQPKVLALMENLATSMQLARGKYLYTLSDDDRLIIKSLLNAITLMEQQPNIVGVFGGHEECDGKANLSTTYKKVEKTVIFPKGFGSKKEIVGKMGRLWHPVIRTEICHRFCLASYNKYAWGYWQFASQMLDHGSIAVIPDIFYQHLHTKVRAESDLTEGWYHDMYRSDFETFIGEMGQGSTDNLLYVSRKASLAYIQGAKWAMLKGEWINARRFLLRARAYGMYKEKQLRELEQSCLLRIVAERLGNFLMVIPAVQRVVVEEHPVSEMVSSFLSEILPEIDICKVTQDELLSRPTQPQEAILAWDYSTLSLRSEKFQEDPLRQHALMDIVSTCRITNATLQFDL